MMNALLGKTTPAWVGVQSLPVVQSNVLESFKTVFKKDSAGRASRRMQQREAGLQLMPTSEPGVGLGSPLARTLPDPFCPRREHRQRVQGHRYRVMDAGCAGGAGHCRRAPGPPRPTRSRRGLAGHGEAGAHRRRPLATLAAVANGDRESDPRGAWRRAARGVVGRARRAVRRKPPVRPATGAGVAGTEHAVDGVRSPLGASAERKTLRVAPARTRSSGPSSRGSIGCRSTCRSY